MLVSPEGFVVDNTPPLFPTSGENGSLLDTTIPRIGGYLDYTIPQPYDQQGDEVTVSVFLGAAEEFVEYNALTGGLSLIDPNVEIQPGVYEILVVVHDDSSEGSRAQEYTITIRVADDGTSQELPYELYTGVDKNDIKDVEEFLDPVIKEVGMTGILTLAFDKDIIRPANDTYFEEQLRALIYTEDLRQLGGGKVVKTPSFEVEIDQSEAHEERIGLSWEYIGWKNDREF